MLIAAGAEQVTIALANGQHLEAGVRATDPFTDLGVLDVSRELPPATFAGELPDVGDLAAAMGSSPSFENSVTAGIVSGLQRSIPSEGRTPALVHLIQTAAAISPGDSGGALVGEPIRTVEDRFATLRELRPRDAVALTLVRQGDRAELEAVLDERAEPEGSGR